jgi:hypothetical protein
MRAVGRCRNGEQIALRELRPLGTFSFPGDTLGHRMFLSAVDVYREHRGSLRTPDVITALQIVERVDALEVDFRFNDKARGNLECFFRGQRLCSRWLLPEGERLHYAHFTAFLGADGGTLAYWDNWSVLAGRAAGGIGESRSLFRDVVEGALPRERAAGRIRRAQEYLGDHYAGVLSGAGVLAHAQLVGHAAISW